MLDFISSVKRLKGFPIVDYKIISSEEQLNNLRFPIYLKASIPEHKTEKNAVKRCGDIKEARDNLCNLKKLFPKEKIIAQKEIRGEEFIIGLKKDRTFGKILMIGSGGISVEAFRDISFRAIPLNKKEIIKMVKELKIFGGVCKRKKLAWEKLVSIAEKTSKLNNEIEDLDLNPIIVNEKEAIIVDARIN